MKLLTVANAKTVKGEKLGWRTGILYLAPHNISGHRVCPYSTRGCRKICLYTAGRGSFSNVQKARVRKTNWLFDDRKGFIDQLHSDIDALAKQATRAGLKPCVRLNGTSDIRWWRKAYGEIPQAHPDIQFYGYTKDPEQARGNEVTPDNWHTVLSYTGTSANTADCASALAAGINVAVIFKPEVPVGSVFLGHKVVDGDTHDLRFMDPAATVVGLKAKGRARTAMHNPMVVSLDHADLN